MSMSSRLYRACMFIYKYCGSCPLEVFDYDKIDCENVCSNDPELLVECWVKYFNDANININN